MDMVLLPRTFKKKGSIKNHAHSEGHRPQRSGEQWRMGTPACTPHPEESQHHPEHIPRLRGQDDDVTRSLNVYGAGVTSCGVNSKCGVRLLIFLFLFCVGRLYRNVPYAYECL